MIIPKRLEAGAEVRIISTARKIEAEKVEEAKKLIESWGLRVSYGEHLLGSHHQFSGSLEQRVYDLQQAINDPLVGMIWLARGGYGTTSLIDKIDFAQLKMYPKWVVGYSDATSLLCHLDRMGFASIHGPMPVSVGENLPAKDLEALRQLLFEGSITYPFLPHKLSRPSAFSGKLVGGNLSVLSSILGSSSVPSFAGRILFLEDLDEYLYHIDRMMLNLKRNGCLEALAGLIVGGLTDMHDNEIPFGMDAEEVINSYVADAGYPVIFGFEAGHVSPNLPLPFGVPAIATESGISFRIHDLG